MCLGSLLPVQHFILVCLYAQTAVDSGDITHLTNQGYFDYRKNLKTPSWSPCQDKNCAGYRIFLVHLYKNSLKYVMHKDKRTDDKYAFHVFSFDLLYQLQVKNKQGDYIKASPIDDTVVINIGDLMQRWTTDKLVSTVSLHIFCFPSVRVVLKCHTRISNAPCHQ